MTILDEFKPLQCRVIKRTLVLTDEDNAWEQLRRIFKFGGQTAIKCSGALVLSDKRANLAASPVGKAT